MVIIYFINSVIIYFLTFFSCEEPGKGYLVMCGFLENNIFFLRLGTPAIVTLFLLQTDPGPPSEKGKVMWPSQEKVWGPLL